MKEKHERYDKEDLELLTKLKITIPKDFHSYMHMLRNMEFLWSFLAGEDSLVRQAWQSAVEHARNNEKLYTDQGESDKIFYCTTMYDFHRRFHTYLQSCAFGKYEKLKLRQLDFPHIYDDIEEDRYSIRSGYCWGKGCRYSTSHGKKLSEAEKKERKKYLADLVAKYNVDNNTRNAVAPSGNPPGEADKGE